MPPCRHGWPRRGNACACLAGCGWPSRWPPLPCATARAGPRSSVGLAEMCVAAAGGDGGFGLGEHLHPKVIQERLGHATMAGTMDTYGHLFPDASEHGRGALDAMFAPAGVRPM